MKNSLIVILFTLAFGIKVFSQSPCQFAYIPIAAGSFNYNVSGVTTDGFGNMIYVGKIANRADMNPSPLAADTSYSLSGANIFISKVGSDGHLKWIKYFKNPTAIGSFEFIGVRVNTNNEIIIVGNFYGLVNFDLSPTGVDTLRSGQPTYTDYFVAKYDSVCNHLWAFNIKGNAQGNMVANSFALKSNNQIVLSVNRSGGGNIDLDPGTGVHNVTSSNSNIVCYDNAGNYVWHNNIAQTFSYPVPNKSIETDSLNNSYLLSVGSYELTVCKFNANGDRLWNKKIGNFSSGSRVTPLSVLVEKGNGSFYIAGTYGGTVDFDPNAAAVNRTASSGSYQDAFIAKYDSAMNLLWVNAYTGNAEFGKYSLDYAANDIIAAGGLKGTINFGNGISLTSASTFGAFYIKLNNAGAALNGYVLNGTSSFYNIICSSSNQSYFAAGVISGTIDMDPTAAVVNITSGNSTNFISSYGTLPSFSTLNLKLYLQGYYDGAGLMKPALLNQTQNNSATNTDSVTVEIRNSTSPYAIVASSNFVLQTNGTMNCTFSPALSGSYYIAIKQKNHLTTWSKLPVIIGLLPASYDFTH